MIYDVVLIGAGIIGSMLARELSRYDLSVCLLEKENDVAMGATKANSGIIHGGYDPVPGTLKARLNSEGVELLFQAASELHVPCKRNGSMVCAFSTAEEAMLEALYQRGQANGITGLRLISGDEARGLEPALSPAVTRVLLVPNAGIISPYELAIAAVGNAMDNGAVLQRNFEVNAIAQESHVFTVTSKEGTVVRGRFLVNCAGGFADIVASMAGDGFFQLIPRAGEYMLLDKDEGSRIRHTLFQCPTKEGKGILVSPTVHGNLLTGPTAAVTTSPEQRDTTDSALAVVARFAAKSVPGINFRQVITAFTGVRASEAGGDFLIQASKAVPGLVHAGAIDSPGLTCCVSIARYIVSLLREQGLQLREKESWNGTREDPCAFRTLNDTEKDAFIKSHPEYGKIICRCEMVSEGEIRDAIRKNPPALDMDGVKRRTRSGMGRCQGGFCGPAVMQLLSEELHIPMEEITKSGGDSRMVTGRLGDSL